MKKKPHRHVPHIPSSVNFLINIPVLQNCFAPLLLKTMLPTHVADKIHIPSHDPWQCVQSHLSQASLPFESKVNTICSFLHTQCCFLSLYLSLFYLTLLNSQTPFSLFWAGAFLFTLNMLLWRLHGEKMRDDASSSPTSQKTHWGNNKHPSSIFVTVSIVLLLLFICIKFW